MASGISICILPQIPGVKFGGRLRRLNRELKLGGYVQRVRFRRDHFNSEERIGEQNKICHRRYDFRIWMGSYWRLPWSTLCPDWQWRSISKANSPQRHNERPRQCFGLSALTSKRLSFWCARTRYIRAALPPSYRFFFDRVLPWPGTLSLVVRSNCP